MNEQIPVNRAERTVGVFVVVAVLLLLTGFGYYLYHTAERKGWRVPRVPYYTFVQDAEGLEIGDPVKLMGFEIGELTIIEAQPPSSYYHVFLGLQIRQPYYGYIWTDSVVRVTTAGLLGRRQLEITKGVAGGPTVSDTRNRPTDVLVDGQMVSLLKSPKGVFLAVDESPSVTARAEKLLGQVESALPNILMLTNRLNLVLDNSAALASNANQLVTEVRPGMTGLLTSADTNIALLAGNLNETLLNLAAITGNLNTQVQSNDQMLAGISKLVVDADTLVQGLKKHWLLRGVFAKPSPRDAEGSGRQTNAPPAKSR